MHVLNEIEAAGHQQLEGLFSTAECQSLAAELDVLFRKQQAIAKSKIGGIRNLLSHTQVQAFALSPRLLAVLRGIMDADPFPVRAIFFDKTPATNWLVPWHQDLAIAVFERIETPGFTAWTIKEGVNHVQPPIEILERMVTVRIHLDDCDRSNGPLKVISGSHAHGRLSAPMIADWSRKEVTLCEVRCGDVLLMRPLILHASSQAEKPAHRRVLHIEYAAEELPNSLNWLERL